MSFMLSVIIWYLSSLFFRASCAFLRSDMSLATLSSNFLPLDSIIRLLTSTGIFVPSLAKCSDSKTACPFSRTFSILPSISLAA